MKALLLMPLLLAGCVSAAVQPSAPDSLTSAVRSGTLHDGKGHVVACLGTFHALLANVAMGSPSDLSVNGVTVGGVNRHDCLLLSLPAGSYSFAWKERVDFQPITSAPAVMPVETDKVTFIQFDASDSGGSLLGGVGLLVDGYKGSAAAGSPLGDRRLVLPDAVASALQPL